MTEDRPVAMIAAEPLLDDLLRLAAAAGCDLERVPDLPGLRVRWQKAPLVLLDGPGATAVANAKLARRSGVIVVSHREPEQAVWQQAVAIGAEQVLVLPAAESWLISAFADTVDRPATDAGKVLAILGGRGGAGASVFAAAVALSVLRGGANALLLDGDPLGGGADLLLGAEAEEGLRWPELRLSDGRVAASSLHAALPGRTQGRGRLTVLSCDREGPGPQPNAVATVVESGRRAGEVVVCDLGRDLPEAACVVLERADLTVLVLPAEVRACAAAKQVLVRVRDSGATPCAVVRGPAPGGLMAREVAAAVGLPLLAAMRPEPGIAVALERGQFRLRSRGPLATAAATVLDALREPEQARAAS
ncbi:MAG: septum site-determining protein Ssd [Sciscionella sp.]